MKRTFIIIATLLLTATAMLSFKIIANNDIMPKQDNYEAQWEEFHSHIHNCLPESAQKVLNTIEKQAVKDNNQVQLLKAILYRQLVMVQTEEEEYEEKFLQYALAQLDRLDAVPRAVLHEEIAAVYANYLAQNEYRINQNLAIDGDLTDVAMKYWDKATFQSLIEQHYLEALKPIEDLKNARTEDYICLYEHPDKEYVEYEPTMFDFLFHRVEKHYSSAASADDIQPGWNTDLWWLESKDFVKADLGDSDSPLVKCLKIFQQLIAENIDNEDLLLYNDYKRYQFVNGILDEHDLYQKAMRSLMAQYRNNKQFADLSNCLATSLIRQHDETPGDSTYLDNYRKAAEICQEAIKAYPEHAILCKNTLSYLTSSKIRVKINNVQLPRENIPAILEYRNCEHPYFKIVKIEESELEQLDRMYDKERVEFLNKKKAVTDWTLDLPAESDYLSHSSVIAVPPLGEGIYYLLGITDKAKQNDPENFFSIRFLVSNLGFISDSKPNLLTLVTVDRKTGYPLPGVTVEITRRLYNSTTRTRETVIVQSSVSDKDGRVLLTDTLGHDYFNIILRKGNDVLLPQETNHVASMINVTGVYDRTKIYTDRSIYRPGQTVYFKGITIHLDNGQQDLATNLKECINFKDANRQVIASANFTTDEYGAFDGSFVIPNDLLNGTFYLEGKYGSTSILVEEYKRPTFEIHFDGAKEQYKLNQDVTVRGSVDAYAGFGLDDVKYTYRVVRTTDFPWRCWWYWYPAVENEPIDFGEGRTDGNGKFNITFNLKPSLKTKPEQQPVFTYEIEVTATSAQGETHSKTFYIRAGYNELVLGTNVYGLMEQSEIGKGRVYVSNMNGAPASSRVSRKIYRLDDDSDINYFDAFKVSASLDRQLLSDEELHTLFPNYGFTTKTERMQHKTLVFQDEVNITDEAPFYPDKKALKPGRYYVELKSLDDPLAQITKEFTVYQNTSKKLPYNTMTWYHADKGTAQPGETVRFDIGSSAKDVKVWVILSHGDEIRMERWITLNNNIQSLEYTVTEADRGGLSLQTAFIKDNSYNLRSQHISVPYKNLDLNVTLATVRDPLAPGGEETWTVNVKDYKDKPVEAALMAGMYDVSLDEFHYHYWSLDMSPVGSSTRAFSSDKYSFVSSNTPYVYLSIVSLFPFDLPSDYPFIYVHTYRIRPLGNGIRAKGAGMPVEDGLVYDAVEYKEASTEAVVIPQQASEEALVAESDEEFSGDDTTNEQQPEESKEPPLRENFNETAFFFPNLRTEADGSSTFTFTMPDAITRWKLMMIAYTKDGKTGNNEYLFKTSKPVMIMADMPRYLYDTDTLWFVANIINTGDEAVTPKAKLEIFDAATMQPVDLILSDAVVPMKEIVPGRSQEVRWKVAAQYDLNLLAFRFTAYAGQFSDAEQHLMPVLSSEIFMTQTLPITVKAETEKTFDFEAIANPDSHERDYSLTLNFSTNPVWYAVQSLPYLANIKTDRPENAFYVFYANSLSAYIADHIPNLLAYIKRWQIETPDALLSQLEKDQDLKAIMLQETPWVLEAKSETEQRARIANLFDLNTLRQQQSYTLSLLAKKQQYNGGWPWMEGMPESPYITAYILEGMGRLKQMGVWESMSKADQRKAEDICDNAVRFIEYDIAERYREMLRLKMDWGIGGFTLQELYALSFFEEQNSDSDFAKAKKYYLSHLDDKKEWTKFSFNDRSYAAIVLYRNGRETTAKLIIQSFKECAQKNEEIGMYWPKKYFSYLSHIATHANIMAAFAEIDQDQEMIDQLRVWLLTQKRTNMWENSSSTADAIYALLMRGSDWFEEGKDVTLSFSGTPISTEGGEAGTGFIQRRWNANEVTEDMRHLTVNNPTEHLVWGGLFRQYFVPIDEVKSDESGFKIKREIFVETVTENGKLLVPIGKRTLKIGDKVTVKLTFESPQDMSFVFVKDLRAAGFEPIEQISRYKCGDGICYYQSTTDTDMEFFIDFLPKGIHQVEYSYFVTKEGNLSNGYALIQCQYAPEFGAYSSGMRVVVKSE